MQCPHCGDEAQIPEIALLYADYHSRPCITRVDCCGKAVRLAPVRRWAVWAASPVDGRDDWGKRVSA